MFARLGRFAARYRWFIVAAWVVAAAALTLLAPSIDDVAVNDQRAFLPAKTQSLDAVQVVKRDFPNRISPSTSVIVLDAGKGNKVRSSRAWPLLEQVTTWLGSAQRPAAVDRILSPTTADKQTADALISKDGQVALAVVDFNAVGTEHKTRTALDAITQRLEKAPPGTRAYLTGDASILAAYDQASRKSLDSTTWITIILVIAILLLIYRSPVSPFIPLLTIGLAYLISRGVVAFLGDGVMTISGYTNIFLIVILFGAGTDYCLFLISRFREEMADLHAAAPAVARTVRTVGETIASSAGTVIVGLSTMALAELGLFNTTGPAVAIGVAIALAAGLTLTPALLSILGDHTFWPRRARHMSEGRFWHRWAGVVTGRPVLALLATLIVLVPLAIYGQGQQRDFDLLGDLPDNVPAHEGYRVLADHLGPGVMQPINVVLEDKGTAFDTPAGLRRLQAVTKELDAVGHVARVTSFTSSLGSGSTLSVNKQLSDYAKGVEDGNRKLAAMAAVLRLGAPTPPSAQSAIQEAGKGLLDIFSYLQQLGNEYPEVTGTEAYRTAMASLQTIAQAAGVSPTAPGTTQTGTSLGVDALPTIQPALGRLASSLRTLQADFAKRPNALMLPKTYVASNEGLRSLRSSYLSKDGQAARFQVILDTGPYAPAALATIERLRELVARQGGGAVEGTTAIVADLRDSSNRDMSRVIVFVLAGIFVVLVLLLRAIVAPIYLILTILLSYGATLGIIRIVFGNVLHSGGVTWWVPIFMFVMLVALGMDYNIFLMGRVKEEVARSGNREGVRTAVARTGGIITSAGIIMAGTFAAMISGQILGLRQIGLAVAVGVLLDTFIVRTTLVPAIAVLLGRGSWWPRRAGSAAAAPRPSPSDPA